MKDVLSFTIFCSAVAWAILGLLNFIVGLEFIAAIVSLAGMVLLFSVYLRILMAVVSFIKEKTSFFRGFLAATIMSIVSIIAYSINDFALFHLLFVGFAIIAAVSLIIQIFVKFFG